MSFNVQSLEKFVLADKLSLIKFTVLPVATNGTNDGKGNHSELASEALDKVGFSVALSLRTKEIEISA